MNTVNTPWPYYDSGTRSINHSYKECYTAAALSSQGDANIVLRRSVGVSDKCKTGRVVRRRGDPTTLST